MIATMQFGGIDWCVLVAYFVAVLSLGVYFGVAIRHPNNSRPPTDLCRDGYAGCRSLPPI